MEINKKYFGILNNFIPQEVEGGIQAPVFEISFDGANKHYHGIMSNTTMSSNDIWKAFWTEENENDYDFCMTFHYDGSHWRIHLSGIVKNLNDVFNYAEELLKEIGITKYVLVTEDYNPSN